MHSICQLNVVNFFHKNFFHTCLVGCWICICNTLSQYPGWIHLAEFYGENRSRKINTWGKGFGLFITPLALYNLVHPGDRFVSISLIAFLVFPVKTLLRGITQENFENLTFSRVSWEISTVALRQGTLLFVYSYVQ